MIAAASPLSVQGDRLCLRGQPLAVPQGAKERATVTSGAGGCLVRRGAKDAPRAFPGVGWRKREGNQGSAEGRK